MSMFNMMKKTGLVLTAVSGIVLGGGVALASEHAHIEKMDWSFNGPFGTYDRAQLQRGFQVYKEVCSACHSVKRLAFRNLLDLDFSEAEVKAIAAGYEVTDGPNKEGEMFQRPAKPSDHIPGPHANEQAARAANGGALPPDLSLIAKAREGGPDYVHALLTGYGEPPADIVMNTGMNYNKVFLGNQIAMPQPLSDGQVEYSDGTKASVDQMSQDVAAFLMWSAEPKMEDRKAIGFRVMIFLGILTILLYFVKKKVWSDVEK